MSIKTIKRGDKGVHVTLLQGLLRHLDYVIDTDGKFGADTEEAVKQFQHSAGLDVDGIIGQDTAACLNMTLWNTARDDDDTELDFTSA